jgi:predicted PurR-regulated permease PerM
MDRRVSRDGVARETTNMSAPERVVVIRPRTVATVAGVLLLLACALWVVWIARQALTWILVAMFLATALDPAVSALERRGLKRRGAATAAIFLLGLLALAGLTALLLPPLIDQVRGLAEAVPGYVDQLTAGRGPLGWLERDYHVVDKAQKAVSGDGATRVLGGAGTVLSITRGVVGLVFGLVTIAFLTLFMVLEGPAWIERGLGLLPPAERSPWRRVARRIREIVAGYITGNLLISAIAGTSSAIVLLLAGVPFPVALGLLVAILDLIPLAGATLAGIVLATVAFLTSLTAGIVVLGFFLVYQVVENHLLQPLVYGRTVELSPLVVLVAILIGSEVAGVLGALGAIPVAGTLEVLLAEVTDRGSAAPHNGSPDGAASAAPSGSRLAER